MSNKAGHFGEIPSGRIPDGYAEGAIRQWEALIDAGFESSSDHPVESEPHFIVALQSLDFSKYESKFFETDHYVKAAEDLAREISNRMRSNSIPPHRDKLQRVSILDDYLQGNVRPEEFARACIALRLMPYHGDAYFMTCVYSSARRILEQLSTGRSFESCLIGSLDDYLETEIKDKVDFLPYSAEQKANNFVLSMQLHLLGIWVKYETFLKGNALYKSTSRLEMSQDICYRSELALAVESYLHTLKYFRENEIKVSHPAPYFQDERLDSRLLSAQRLADGIEKDLKQTLPNSPKGPSDQVKYFAKKVNNLLSLFISSCSNSVKTLEHLQDTGFKLLSSDSDDPLIRKESYALARQMIRLLGPRIAGRFSDIERVYDDYRYGEIVTAKNHGQKLARFGLQPWYLVSALRLEFLAAYKSCYFTRRLLEVKNTCRDDPVAYMHRIGKAVRHALWIMDLYNDAIEFAQSDQQAA